MALKKDKYEYFRKEVYDVHPFVVKKPRARSLLTPVFRLFEYVTCGSTTYSRL